MNRVAKSAQREHRERAQLPHRAHLGQLEKKKDYKLRADDYNKKKQAIKALQQKAAEKNPDEFYYHMISSKVKDGVHHEGQSRKQAAAEQKESADVQQLLQCKDLRYVLFKLNTEKKKVDRLKATLHLTDPAFRTNKRTVFVDDDQQVGSFSASSYLDSPAELLGSTAQTPRHAQLQSAQLASATDRATLRTTEKRRARKYEELRKRLDRLAQLQVVADKLQLQQHLAANNSVPPTKLKDGTPTQPALYKWKFERKR